MNPPAPLLHARPFDVVIAAALASMQTACFVDTGGGDLSATAGGTSTTSSGGDLTATAGGTSTTSSAGETTAKTTDPATSDTGGASMGGFTFVPKPASFSGLAYDGTSLWYSIGSATAQPIDPDTGAPGTPVAVAGYVHAAQGTAFWTHCGCGGSPEATLQPLDGEPVDTVHTETDLGNDIIIRGIAYDSVGKILYLAGTPGGSHDTQLLHINSDAEPDVLLKVDLIERIGDTGITWDGQNVWAIASTNPQTILRIDVSSGTTTATYPVPDTTITWRGIAAVGPRLFLLGSKSDQGVLSSLMPGSG